MKITGTIAKTPVVKDKVIFSAIKEAEGQKPIQLVLFRQSRPISLSNMLNNVKLNDQVTISGRMESNPRTNEPQIIIDDIEVQHKDTSCPEYF